jgi:hypothetical protein
MSTALKHDLKTLHIPLTALWQSRTDNRVLTTEEIIHIVECHGCLAMLGVCQMAHSLVDVERRIEEIGN